MRPLSICIVSTTSWRSRKGNRVTAVRWSRLLRSLGHRVRIEEQYDGRACDVLVALHARRSFPSVQRFARRYPERPIILALTGTDLYRDIRSSRSAKKALAKASRLVVLQPLGVAELPAAARAKAQVILQSAPAPSAKQRPKSDAFEVCVLGHLRPVKDSFRAAQAARKLPSTSRIRILQVGGAFKEQRVNPRYRWLGELPRAKALRVMGRCRLLALTSRMEGGANVISEAVTWGVPVLSSRIPGSIGLLGPAYPGYFEPEDTAGLTKLLLRSEKEPPFLRTLRRDCAKLAPRFRPQREREAWARLLREVA